MQNLLAFGRRAVRLSRAFLHCGDEGVLRAALTADIAIAAGADLTGPLTPNDSYSWLKFALHWPRRRPDA
jgi:hypothetical protein